MGICVEPSQCQVDVQEVPYLQQFGKEGGHLFLHFDVNKTLCADDVAGGKPEVAMVIQELLAERFFAKWEPGLDEAISYSDYVKTRLFPGDKYDPAVRKRRFEKLHHFVEDYGKSSFGKALRGDFQQMAEALRGREIFESFFHCIRVLSDLDIPTTVVLRTFGEDLPRVTQIIESELPEVCFQTGAFEAGVFLWKGTPVTDIAACLDRLHQHRWVAIQDDFSSWRDGGKLAEYGKPFPIDLCDASTHAMFFDDNIELNGAGKTNIVGPIGPQGEVPISKLAARGQLVQVDTAQAILDKNYFIVRINESLGARYSGQDLPPPEITRVMVEETLRVHGDSPALLAPLWRFLSYLLLITKQFLTHH